LIQTKPSEPIAKAHHIDAVRVTALSFGVYAGLLGMEHGFLETLQGNVATKGLKIMAAGRFELPFPFGHEPAMTLIPNFLVTGVAALFVGLAVIVWSVAFVQKRRGAGILLLLSAILLLVGGGFGPISLLIVACIAASRIDKQMVWWRKHLPIGLRRVLARLWVWSLVGALAYVPCEYILGQVLRLKNDPRQVLDNLNLMLTYPMLVLFTVTLIAGFARVIDTRKPS
jgi:hypothetical protein